MQPQWGNKHVKEMLNFLINKLPEMGDGDFKMQTWHQLFIWSQSFLWLKERGREWPNDFMVMKALKGASGFQFSEKNGACVMLEMVDTWLAFVKVHVQLLLA
ncbi:hypothetical protein SCLCIDRAFT_145191 [Scleroderma citrinum Foug A]|uniref:Uncharacterized protein n=1 Tax=Scleroderma citrinum Foug A TaxID=1036808 RepID=A0A0C3CPP8_9AGAM|nr:hypothetical protein SCLCIDRAFT_145191 [Scleroderma citrinum Foug A]